MAVADKSPLGQGEFGLHCLQSPLLILSSSYTPPPLCTMSPLLRQPTIFLQSKLTEELNSEPFWIDGLISSVFHEDSFRSLEGAATPLEGSPTLHLLPSFEDDNLGPPSLSSGGAERVNFVGFNSDPCPMPFGIKPDDLYVTFSLSLLLSITTTHYSSSITLRRVASTTAISSFTLSCSATTTKLVSHRRH